MNDSSRHAVWVVGMLGSLTLSQWNTIVGIACGAAGFVAACLSIYSWVEKRRRRREKEETPNGGLAKAESRNEPSKRKHHHRTLIVFLVLLAALLIAAMAEGQEVGGQRSEVGAQNAWAVQVADDVRKLVYDFLSRFSWAGLFAAYLGVKGLRNFTPLGRSAGKIGTLLRLINLEALDGVFPQPSSGRWPPAPAPAGGVKISEQQTETKGQAQQ